MKICIVTTSFPHWPGDGHAPFIYEAARAIQRKGHQVRVIAMHVPGTKTHEWWDGIEVIRPRYLPEKWEVLQKEGGGLPEVWKKHKLARLALLPFMLVHIITVARYAHDCDIVHANWTLSGMAAWLSQPVHRKPYVVTVQGSDIYQIHRYPLIIKFTQMVLSNSSAVIALSRSLSEQLISFGLDKSKITLVPNGVDIIKFAPGPVTREHYILFVGSLIKRKGVEDLLYAFSEVVHNDEELNLVIAGEGPLYKDLIKLGEALGIIDRINLLGKVTQDQVAYLMRHAKLFILPSLEEGLGVVLLEALASGTPCIASSVGGILDIVNQENGILVEPANPKAFANAILHLLSDVNRWRIMSINARSMIEKNYSWNIIGDMINDLYNNVFYRVSKNYSIIEEKTMDE